MGNLERIRKASRILLATSAIVLTSGVGLSLAAFDGEGGNNTTGPYSRNRNIWELSHIADINLRNDSRADNLLNLYANSGRNEIEKNTAVEDGLRGGDISGDFELVNDLGLGNGGSTGTTTTTSHRISPDLSNSLTGPYSENRNKVTLDSRKTIDVRNDANVDNDINIYANTGENKVSKNTVVGDVETGDVDIRGEIENRVGAGGCPSVCPLINGALSGNDMGDFDAEFSNEVTGPDSVNVNEVKVNHEVDIDVRNNTDFNNKININGNSGNNEVTNNTVVGGVRTGDVSLDFSVLNKAN